MVVKASGLHKALPAVASFLNLSAPPPSLQSGAESPPADDGRGAGPACPPSYPDMKPVRSDPGAADSCPTRNRLAVLLQVRVSKFPLRLIQTSRLGVLTKPVIIRLALAGNAGRLPSRHRLPSSGLLPSANAASSRPRPRRRCRLAPSADPGRAVGAFRPSRLVRARDSRCALSAAGGGGLDPCWATWAGSCEGRRGEAGGPAESGESLRTNA